MIIKKILFTALIGFALNVNAQQKTIVIADYENKPATAGWWKDNANVTFSYDDNPAHQVDATSKVCLHVRWDSIPPNRPRTWFTDLKADTFAVEGMENKWKEFQDNTWMSFWYKAGVGDTLNFQYLVLSKGHKSKWGAKGTVPATSLQWTFVKVKFADLQYDNWGQVVAPFDLKSDAVKCFEIGLRSAATSKKGYVEAWFDNIRLTNYEPFPRSANDK